MDRKAVANVLDEIASYLELKGEEPFRVRTYRTAARAVSGLSDDLNAAVARGALAELKGIGPATQEVIEEVLATGRSRLLEDLRDQIPSGLVEMLRIPGLGVAKVRQIHETLRLDTLDELEQAATDGRLAKLARFGPKVAEKVLKGIRFRRSVSEFRLLHHARAEAAELVDALTKLPGVAGAEVAGSVRRGCEVIRDLDFVVLVERDPSDLIQRLGTLAGVRETVHHEPGAGSSVTLRFASGTVVDLFWATTRDVGFQLLRATGSDAHITALRDRAQALGLAWTDCGLARSTESEASPSPDEATVYRALGLPYVPPEMREGTGELEAAAAGALPTLLETGDLRGFLHCHSNYSDGTSTIREWAAACRDAGYAYVGITDHSPSTAYAGGLAEGDVAHQHAEIDQTNAEFKGMRVLKGVEADIRHDGSLDYTPATRRAFDFVIASVHTRHGMDQAAMTARVLRAMDEPTVAILGHPTGRLLLSRDPFPLDTDAVFEKAARLGIAIEINADPQRLDLDWRLARRAAAAGVTISIGADAHSVAGMANMDLGVTVARKGWLTANQVLNTRSADEFLAFVRARRKPQ
jgi:DNA polymerase (family 10)